MGDVPGGEHLFCHGLQKILLGGHTAQILAAVAGTVVIVTEADHPQGVRAVEVLHSLLEVDAEVLDGVIVVHVDGDLKINAADSVHQRGEALQVHADGVIHGNPQLLGDRVRQQGDSALIVGVVDFVGLTVNDGLGIPGMLTP